MRQDEGSFELAKRALRLGELGAEDRLHHAPRAAQLPHLLAQHIHEALRQLRLRVRAALRLLWRGKREGWGR